MTGALFVLVAASKSSSGSSTTFIVFLVLIALVGYFLLIRPQKQRARRQREQQSNIGVGDEVLTVGGIVGRVVAMDADRVTILTGGDTVGFPAAGSEPARLVLVRNAIARKIEPPAATNPSEDATADSTHDYSYDGDEHHDGAVDDGNTAAGDRPAESGGTSP